MTYREIIYKTLEQYNDWVPSHQIIKADTPFGWLGTSADRIARYMLDPRKPEYTPDLERKRDGKYTYYRIKPGQIQLI
jgi:hypothetical protein